MGRKPLFDRDHVLGVLHDWIVKNGAPPTIQQLAKGLKVKSTRPAVRYLRLLEEDGSLERRGSRGVLLHRVPNHAEDKSDADCRIKLTLVQVRRRPHHAPADRRDSLIAPAARSPRA